MARMIDADELVKVIENLLYEPDSVQYVWSSDVLSAIRSAPTVQLAPVVHGRWEEVDDVWDDLHYRCSACGCEWFLEDGTPAENGMNYCPNCGAKMDGEEVV